MQKNSHRIHFIIGGLSLSIVGVPIVNANLSPSQIKFRQTGKSLQAVSFPCTTRALNLETRDVFNVIRQDQFSIIYQSETWTFIKDNNGNLIFQGNDTVYPMWTQISPDFNDGFIGIKLNTSNDAFQFWLDTLEINVATAWLASFGDLILHASGISTDGRGYCFVGESGAGKSTLAAALAADPAVIVLGEDQVILRFIDGQFWIFGTPWHTDPKKCSPLGVPLERLYFLDRTLSPGVGVVKPADGVARLLQTAFVPYYLPEFLPGILERLSMAAQQVPFYSLSYLLGSDHGLLLK